MNGTTPPGAVRVSGLVFVYPGIRALDDVSFDIGRGSVTALVGPNGAGKTTLLRCLAGLDRPIAGSVTVAGIDVLDEPRRAHELMGYLSDFYGLYDSLTVRQCLIHAASGRSVPAAAMESTVESTAARLDIADFIGRRCAELSRGQRQRVAVGMAIVHAPEVLLLDEPAAGLDPEARHSLARLFTRLRGEGMTLVVSSHILAELDEYSTHMLVLRAGRIIEHRGLPGELAAAGRRVRVRFASGNASWLGALDQLRGARVVESGERDAVLAIDGGEVDQARILRDLVSAGSQVTAFAEEREDLHQTYLRTVRNQKDTDES